VSARSVTCAIVTSKVRVVSQPGAEEGGAGRRDCAGLRTTEALAYEIKVMQLSLTYPPRTRGLQKIENKPSYVPLTTVLRVIRRGERDEKEPK